MSTLVFFHAHPDDESIATGGTMRRAADEGHRTILVLGTRGECGEVPEGFLGHGEDLGDRRVQETMASAALLGVARVEFLGYRDSGMMGEPTNDDPACFWQADLEEAAGRLAAILTEESAEVLTVYDSHGGYGHPDHIQVHRVGHRAAKLAGTPRVFESTMNRDHIARSIEAAREAGADIDPPEVDGDEEHGFGTPEAELTTFVDVSAYVDAKRESMVAHASQIGEESFFLQMPEEAFAHVFGTEWFMRVGGDPAARESWLLSEGR